MYSYFSNNKSVKKSAEIGIKNIKSIKDTKISKILEGEYINKTF